MYISLTHIRNTFIITYINTLYLTIGITMSALTIRLPDKLLTEVDKRAQKLRITRAEYIRKSIEDMIKKYMIMNLKVNLLKQVSA